MDWFLLISGITFMVILLSLLILEFWLLYNGLNIWRLFNVLFSIALVWWGCKTITELFFDPIFKDKSSHKPSL